MHVMLWIVSSKEKAPKDGPEAFGLLDDANQEFFNYADPINGILRKDGKLVHQARLGSIAWDLLNPQKPAEDPQRDLPYAYLILEEDGYSRYADQDSQISSLPDVVFNDKKEVKKIRKVLWDEWVSFFEDIKKRSVSEPDLVVTSWDAHAEC